MNRSLLRWAMVLAVCAAWLGSIEHGRSQAAVVPNTVTPTERLEALKAANAALLERQAQTLQKLDDLKQTAEQIRIMTKRS